MQYTYAARAALTDLRENRRRFLRYVEQLRDLLIEAFDDHTGALADWDWQWPQHLALALRLSSWQRFEQVLPASAKRPVQEAYADLAAMPPSMLGWVDVWDGNLATSLRFLVRQLHEVSDAVIEKLSVAEKVLQSASSDASQPKIVR